MEQLSLSFEEQGQKRGMAVLHDLLDALRMENPSAEVMELYNQIGFQLLLAMGRSMEKLPIRMQERG